ncbi:CocE/NonD family hydrolase [Winogradskyella sp.]|uniref:CocE/NonD family hydrolase n=1 Tax=Winogradskyella sp. TaxID=1883156 RepID=UPI002626E25E|nr:CocE/NonD family hydrolase [Winogradskyella sp.]
MKIRISISSLLLASTLISFSQNFYFPKKNYNDSTILAKSLPKLAEQLQESLTISWTEVSMNTKMNLALAAKQYENALIYLDSLRLPFNEDYKYGVFVPYEVYAKVQNNIDDNTTFKTLLESQFTQTFTSINVPSQEIIESNAMVSVDGFKKSFETILEQRKASDTIQMKEAIQLIRMFNVYNVFKETVPTLKSVIETYSQKTYTIETANIKVRDSSKLRAHIVRKKNREEKRPTVFIFNIYADSIRDIGRAKFYANKNYNCVVANTRGKSIEGKEISPFEYDGKDAHDIIDWISKQNWSNGEVGMVGGSYLGFGQWAATKQLHPALKTIMPQVAVGPGIDYPMNGNVFMSYMLRWINYVTSNRTTDYKDFSNVIKWNSIYKKWYENGASFRSLDSIEGRPNTVFQRWLDHPSYDSFWQDMVPYKADFSRIDIPVLTTTGYFDDDQMGALYYYKQHHKHNPDAEHYLIIGPYSHGGAQLYPEKEVYGYKADSVATSFNFRNRSVEWFDHILKGTPQPSFLKDKVNFQVMGTNTWYHSNSLSEMSNDTLTLYFSTTKLGANYTLSPNKSAGYIEQKVDFKDRSDTVNFKFEVLKDSITSDIPNSVSYVSEPFEKPTIISGSFINSIKASINKQDVDIVIKIYELMPNGKYFSLFSASGFSTLQRASYAMDRTQRQLLQPEKKETINISTSYITSKQVDKGSRLVVALGINKNPNWQINYGTGKDVSDETIADANEPLIVKWYGDSFIKIPILKE